MTIIGEELERARNPKGKQIPAYAGMTIIGEELERARKFASKFSRPLSHITRNRHPRESGDLSIASHAGVIPAKAGTSPSLHAQPSSPRKRGAGRIAIND